MQPMFLYPLLPCNQLQNTLNQFSSNKTIEKITDVLGREIGGKRGME